MSATPSGPPGPAGWCPHRGHSPLARPSVIQRTARAGPEHFGRRRCHTGITMGPWPAACSPPPAPTAAMGTPPARPVRARRHVLPPHARAAAGPSALCADPRQTPVVSRSRARNWGAARLGRTLCLPGPRGWRSGTVQNSSSGRRHPPVRTLLSNTGSALKPQQDSGRSLQHLGGWHWPPTSWACRSVGSQPTCDPRGASGPVLEGYPSPQVTLR